MTCYNLGWEILCIYHMALNYLIAYLPNYCPSPLVKHVSTRPTPTLPFPPSQMCQVRFVFQPCRPWCCWCQTSTGKHFKCSCSSSKRWPASQKPTRSCENHIKLILINSFLGAWCPCYGWLWACDRHSWQCKGVRIVHSNGESWKLWFILGSISSSVCGGGKERIDLFSI